MNVIFIIYMNVNNDFIYGLLKPPLIYMNNDIIAPISLGLFN